MGITLKPAGPQADRRFGRRGGVVRCAGLSMALAACGAGSADSFPSVTLKGVVASGAVSRTPVTGAYVRVFRLGKSGEQPWPQVSFSPDSKIPNAVAARSDGAYTMRLQHSVAASHSGLPLFVMASDSAGAFTLAAQIPAYQLAVGTEISLDVNPITTAAGVMRCPGGVYPPKSSGAYCWQDPNDTGTTRLVIRIAAALFEDNALGSRASDLPAFIGDLLANVTVKEEMQSQARRLGTDPAIFDSPRNVQDQLANLPVVDQPSAADLNGANPLGEGGKGGGTGTGGTGGVGDSCHCTCDDGRRCTSNSDCPSSGGIPGICARPVECAKCS